MVVMAIASLNMFSPSSGVHRFTIRDRKKERERDLYVGRYRREGQGQRPREKVNHALSGCNA